MLTRSLLLSCFLDYNILFCKKNCLLEGPRRSRITEKGHYHCFGCKNGFSTANRLLTLVQSHFSSLTTYHSLPKTGAVASVSQCGSNDRPQLTQSFSARQSQSRQLMAPSNSYEDILQALPDVDDDIIDIPNDNVSDEDECDDNEQNNLKPALNNLMLGANAQQPLHSFTVKSLKQPKFPNQAPSPTSSVTSESSASDRVPCHICGTFFHSRSLKRHIQTQHVELSSQSSNSITGDISLNHHLRGVCVDRKQGVFLIRKAFRSSDNPILCAVVQPVFQSLSNVA